MKNNNVKRALLLSLINSLIVLGLGFVAMYALYNIIDFPQDLPNLFFYKAATWGDGICLPVMTFCATAFLIKNENYKNLKRRARILMLIAMLIGAAVQISWIISDTTTLNWTIPYKHHFNIAGLWHAVFFCVMFGVSAYFVGECWGVIRRKGEQWDRTDYVLLGSAITAGLLFLLLHFDDDFGKGDSSPFALSATVVAELIILLIYFKSAKASLSAYKVLPLSLMLAYCLSITICSLCMNGDLLITFGGALCITACWQTDKIDELVFTAVVTVCATSTMIYYASRIRMEFIQSIVVAATIAALAIITELVYYHCMQWHSLPLLVILAYMLIQKSPALIREFAGIIISKQTELVDVLLNTALYFIFRKEMKDIFDDVIEEEKRLNGKARVNEDIVKYKNVKIISYTKIVLLLCGILFILGHWFMDIIDKSETAMMFETGQLNPSLGLIIICLIILSFAKNKKIILISYVIEYIVLALASILYMNQSVRARMETVRPQEIMLLIVVLFGWIGAVLLLVYGFKMNVTSLRGNRVNRDIKNCLIIISVGDFIVAACNVLLMVFYLNWGSIVIALINLLFICILIPRAMVKSLEIHENHSKEVVLNTALGGVMQDGFSAFVAQTFIIGIPCVYIGVIRQNNINTWWYLLLFMVSGMIVAEFFIRNNVEHITRQKEKAVNDDVLLDEWFRLRDCIIIQSKITIFATFPYWTLFILIEFIKKISQPLKREEKKISFREWIEKEYIDKQQFEDDFDELKSRVEKYRQSKLS